MATAAEDLNNNNDDDLEEGKKPGEGEEGQHEEGQDQGNGEDSPYAPLAKEMGWVPKDQYQGDGEWRDAETFIRAGRDIQRETSRELKTVRAQLDTIARTSASIVEQQVKERTDELAARYAKAVEDGDASEAFKLSGEIHALKTGGAQGDGARAPSPEAQSFAERNSNWFNKPGFEYATARAVEITNTLAAQGYTDHGQQLKIAEQRLKVEMPQLFKDQRNGKPPAGVHSPGSRSSGASNRVKGFSDMPKEAQDIARDMEQRGVIKSKDDYAKNYFANIEGKA